jgi:CelD/BcsL family acetyltransferase involved in cellulose biosynthesis
MYDEVFIRNWIRRTGWTTIFSGVNRMLLVRLVEAPATDGSLLVYGVFDSERL